MNTTIDTKTNKYKPRALNVSFFMPICWQSTTKPSIEVSLCTAHSSEIKEGIKDARYVKKLHTAIKQLEK